MQLRGTPVPLTRVCQRKQATQAETCWANPYARQVGAGRPLEPERAVNEISRESWIRTVTRGMHQ